MFRLIQAKFASPWQLDFSDDAPSLLNGRRELHPLMLECFDCRLEVIAHQIEFLRAVFLGRVDGHLGRRESENEPAFARVHVGEPQDVAEEFSVRLGVAAVEDDVCPRNHFEFEMTTISLKKLRPVH